MKRPSWKVCGAIILAVMAVGLALNLWRPLYLAPPRLGATWLAYLLVGWAWLPVLIVCAFLLPVGRLRWPVLLVAAGLLAAALGGMFGPPLPSGFWGLQPACQEAPASAPSLVRYECTVNRMFLVDTYLVEGWRGWPFVWPVSSSSINL